MRKSDLNLHIQNLEEQVSKLTETVKFLVEHNVGYMEFVYKNTVNNSTTCYARYIKDGVVDTAIVEKYPSSYKATHTCIENNRDFAIINSTFGAYQLDKKTNKCKCINKKG